MVTRIALLPAALLPTALLLASCGHGQPARSATTGVITGTVRSAPTCPVQGVDQLDCPPRPLLNATVAVFAGRHQTGTTRTTTGGHYRLDVPYGQYTIVATNIGGYRSTAKQSVTVSSVPVVIDLIVDSGIR